MFANYVRKKSTDAQIIPLLSMSWWWASLKGSYMKKGESIEHIFFTMLSQVNSIVSKKDPHGNVKSHLFLLPSIFVYCTSIWMVFQLPIFKHNRFKTLHAHTKRFRPPYPWPRAPCASLIMYDLYIQYLFMYIILRFSFLYIHIINIIYIINYITYV